MQVIITDRLTYLTTQLQLNFSQICDRVKLIIVINAVRKLDGIILINDNVIQ